MSTKKSAQGVRDQERKDQTIYDVAQDVAQKSSQMNCNTSPAKRQGISAYLRCGKQNAVSSSDLLEVLNLSSQRELRHLIAKARENGEIILSDSHGYYLPAHGEEGLQEIYDCVKVLRAKGISTLKAAAAIKKPLREIYGQEIIDSYENPGVLPDV